MYPFVSVSIKPEPKPEPVPLEFISAYKNPTTPTNVRRQIAEVVRKSGNVGVMLEMNDVHLILAFLWNKPGYQNEQQYSSEDEIRRAWEYVCTHKDLTPAKAADILWCISKREYNWHQHLPPLSDYNYMSLALKAVQPDEFDGEEKQMWEPFSRMILAYEMLQSVAFDRARPATLEILRLVMKRVRKSKNPIEAARILNVLRQEDCGKKRCRELYDLIIKKKSHRAAWEVLDGPNGGRTLNHHVLPDDIRVAFRALVRNELLEAFEKGDIKLCKAYEVSVFYPSQSLSDRVW